MVARKISVARQPKMQDGILMNLRRKMTTNKPDF
jgi:hypothetical protein